MKRPTPADYESDSLFPRVQRAMTEILRAGQPVSAPAVFVRMGVLRQVDVEAWRLGRVDYLERVIQGSLSKINRVLRIISLYAHDLQLLPAPPHSAGPVRYRGRALRFSKTGDVGVEECSRRVFVFRPPKRPRPPKDSGVSGSASSEAPSNNQIQLTAPAQAMERRS